MADAPKAVTTVAKGSYDEVVVHPLVLLSVVDHFRRVEEVRDHRPSRAREGDRASTPRRARVAPPPRPSLTRLLPSAPSKTG
jgi:hypothetical protein